MANATTRPEVELQKLNKFPTDITAVFRFATPYV